MADGWQNGWRDGEGAVHESQHGDFLVITRASRRILVRQRRQAAALSAWWRADVLGEKSHRGAEARQPRHQASAGAGAGVGASAAAQARMGDGVCGEAEAGIDESLARRRFAAAGRVRTHATRPGHLNTRRRDTPRVCCWQARVLHIQPHSGINQHPSHPGSCGRAAARTGVCRGRKRQQQEAAALTRVHAVGQQLALAVVGHLGRGVGGGAQLPQPVAPVQCLSGGGGDCIGLFKRAVNWRGGAAGRREGRARGAFPLFSNRRKPVDADCPACWILPPHRIDGSPCPAASSRRQSCKSRRRRGGSCRQGGSRMWLVVRASKQAQAPRRPTWRRRLTVGCVAATLLTQLLARSCAFNLPVVRGGGIGVAGALRQGRGCCWVWVAWCAGMSGRPRGGLPSCTAPLRKPCPSAQQPPRGRRRWGRQCR